MVLPNLYPLMTPEKSVSVSENLVRNLVGPPRERKCAKGPDANLRDPSCGFVSTADLHCSVHV